MAAWQRRFGAARAGRHLRQRVEPAVRRRRIWRARSKRSCARPGWTPSSLKLEITESAFIGDVQAAQVTLKRLQSIGVEWSLDDFGTGYSSLSYLHQLQVDTVKIDRSFVSRIGRRRRAGRRWSARSSRWRTTSRMDVVAEGVETEEQFVHLRALGCEYAQGFHFSRPVDALAADRLIASQPWRHVLEATRSCSANPSGERLSFG